MTFTRPLNVERNSAPLPLLAEGWGQTLSILVGLYNHRVVSPVPQGLLGRCGRESWAGGGSRPAAAAAPIQRELQQ